MRLHAGSGRVEVARSTSSLLDAGAIRDVLYSTTQGDSSEPDRRWINLLKHQIQDAQVELVAELGTAPATIEQLIAFKPGDFIELDLEPMIQAKVDGVPVFDCNLRHVQRALCPQDRQDADRTPTRLGWPRPMTPDDDTFEGPADDEQDAMAAEWAAALAEAAAAPAEPAATEIAAPVEQVSTPTFTNFAPTGTSGAQGDINLILDIPSS